MKTDSGKTERSRSKQTITQRQIVAMVREAMEDIRLVSQTGDRSEPVRSPPSTRRRLAMEQAAD